MRRMVPMRRIIITFLVICLAPSVALADDITEYEREELARMLYGEDRSDDFSTEGIMRKAAVIQVALNRLDAWGGELFAGDSALVRRSQFHGYVRDNPVESWTLNIVDVVCDGWEAEQIGEANVWRVIPANYLYFAAWRGENRFRDIYESSEATYWDFVNVSEEVWEAWAGYLDMPEVADAGG